jgi:ATP-dependent protease ClpP protease subunit
MASKKVKYSPDNVVFDVHGYDIDVDANHIYLFGSEEYGLEDQVEPGIEYVIANRFIRNLNILMRKSQEPILVHMKTCGGYWEEGMAIYDAIKMCPNPVTILCYTHARSMSSIILQAADKRVMMPNSTFMFHDGTMGYSGTTKQFLNEAEQLQKSMITMMEIYVNVMKVQGKLRSWSKKRIFEWLREQMDKKEDVYLSAKQAVQYGFADEVFDGDWESLVSFEVEESDE